MKRVNIDVNLHEVEILLRGLDSMRQALTRRDEVKAFNRIEEILLEQKDNLEQDELNLKMYFEDDDGYEQLTDEGKTAFEENEIWKKSDR